MRKRGLLVIVAIGVAESALFAGLARAADPTKAECLAASSASLQSDGDHKLRLERSQLLVCSSTSCPTVIRKECMTRAEQVSSQIPTLIFGAKDPSGADLIEVKVTMDGEVLAERLDGTSLAIDPGEHSFRFETPGQEPVTRRLLIQEAQKDRHEVIVFGTGTALAGSAVAQPAALAGSTVVEPATLAITTDVDATVSLDGSVVGKGRYREKVPSGSHIVRVTETGRLPFESQIELRDGETRTIDVTLREEKHGGLVWPWVVGGIAVAAGAAVGSYFLFQPSNKTTPVPSGTFGSGGTTLSSVRVRQ
jgi:hypothetical protein